MDCRSIDMLDWVAGAVESTKAAFGITKAMVTLRDEGMVQERVFELNGVLANLQQQLMQAQMEQMQLISKVADLERQNALFQNQSSIKARYELAALGNGYVYKLRDKFIDEEPLHFCCPTCFEAEKRSFLKTRTPHGSSTTYYACHSCDFKVGVLARR